MGPSELWRGEIWWAIIGDSIGSAPAQTRPVLILQANSYNRTRLRTIVAVAVTSNVKLTNLPGNVFLPSGKTGLSKNSVANITQIVTLDRSQLLERIGEISGELLYEVESGVRSLLDL